MSETAAKAEVPASELLRGSSVAPGLVLGQVHRKDYDLARAQPTRVPLDAIDHELNRFRRALDDSATQLRDLKTKLEGRVQPDDARILDTHLAYLKDSAFIADVENLILGQQIGLEAAIAKVIADFDRIFRLVENETLRQSAVDLRDVGIRVLRNLEREAGGPPEPVVAPSQYVLAARELSIVDMFDLSNEHVLGIVTEGGGLTGHAAVFARSMRIPTVVGIEGLLAKVAEGDFVILDATEGVLRVRPGELVVQQYRQAAERLESQERASEPPAWAAGPVRTHDGVELRVAAECGSLPEVDRAAELGMREIGLYRTELLYLVDKEQPSRDSLVRHYAAVVDHAEGAQITFRLLHADSGLGVTYLHTERERNPQLGRAGVRLLLARESILRRQLRAILLATANADARIAIPMVNDCGELRRVKEILFEERMELRRSGTPFREKIPLGCVLETPASLLGLRDLASESDFLLLSLDSLTQYLLAADRDSPELAEHFQTVHPFVLRALKKTAEVCAGIGRELTVFGVTALARANAPLLVGAGVRGFVVPPASLRELLTTLRETDAHAALSALVAAARASCPSEVGTAVAGYRHGFAKPR